MKSLSTSFYMAAAIFALIGMIWGIQMSATHDHTLSPAHGHLNLLGFVAMAVFGTFYALSPDAARSRLATIHFVLAVLSVLVLVPELSWQSRNRVKFSRNLALSLPFCRWLCLRWLFSSIASPPEPAASDQSASNLNQGKT